MEKLMTRRDNSVFQVTSNWKVMCCVKFIRKLLRRYVIMFKERKTRNRCTIIALSAVMGLTIAGIGALGNNYSDLHVDINNLAGSTTRYVNYSGWAHINQKTGKVVSKLGVGVSTAYVTRGQYKDDYTTTATTKITNNNKFKFIDSHKGPTPVTRTEKHTAGTNRKTSFSGNIKKDIVTATIGYETGSSKETTVSKKYTFPGDKKLHTLYSTRRTLDRQGKSKRTSYIQPVTTYNTPKGLSVTPKAWGKLTRHTSRDIALHRTAATTEYQYGTYMN